MRIAVIGSAGRGDDASRLSIPLYDKMFENFCSYVDKWGIDTAVSGGAAFADHLAVRAYLEGKVSNLVLYMPAKFSMSDRAYLPNPQIQFNPGKTSNDYHRRFSKIMKIDSLKQISKALECGASQFVHEGFHTRNIEVATNCDYLVAYTYGNKSSVDLISGDPGFTDAKRAGLKDGGTAHTWGESWNCHSKSHVNLFDLL
jgi:hypothetical protein